MAVDSFVGQADEPLRSAWLKSASQVLPRLTEAGRERGSLAWSSALFGGIYIEGDWTEDDDVIAGNVNQVVAIEGAWTEDDDVMDGLVFVVPAVVGAWTEDDDVMAGVVSSGFYLVGAWTEDDDVMAGVLTSFVNVITPATIEAFEPIGPTIETGPISDEFTVASIDGSSFPVGPLYIADEDDPVFTTGMFIQLFANDGVTLLDDLEQADGVNWLDEANGTGSGTFVLPQTDTVTAALCTPGRLVRCYLYGVEAFTWEISGPPERDELKRGEESQEVLRFSGEGWAGLLDDVIVEPAIPVLESEPDLTTPFGGRDRVFSFASPDYPNDNWAYAYEHYEYHDIQPFRYQTVETLENVFEDVPSPVNMPYPNSEVYGPGTVPHDVFWIWPGSNFFDVGWGFFRGFLIDPPAGSQFTISCSADNLFILYVDGVPVLSENADTLLWTGYKEVTVQISTSRWYMFGAAVQNTGLEGGGWNPGGWLMASYFPGNQGEPIAPGILSHSGWTAMFSANAWPGWTAGQIALRLLYEGNLPHRNAVNGALGYTFTDFSDSHGVPWTVLINGVYSEFVPTFAVRVGSSVLEAFTQLHDEGWVNWHMRSGTTLIDMWSYDSPAQNSGITLEVSSGTDTNDAFLGNLVDVERQPDEQLANALLVAYDDGVTKYVRVTDPTSIALHGRHEEVWDSGGTSPEEATRLGQVELRKRAVNDEGGAIVAVIEPRSLAEMPYHAFNVLDTVAFPSLAGGTFDAVVYSIGVSDDGDGNPIITLELNKRWPDVQRDTSRLLRSIGGKTVGSWKGRL